MRQRISVVTPSLNQGQFLGSCIRSVVDQAYPDLEYIVVEGGSTDTSIETIKAYEGAIAWWVSEADAGQYHALNKGFARATGEILAWRSRPGSMLENAGAVRFRPEGEGTRVDLRLCYSPPIGGAGRAVAELLGADPRAKLNEDLGRLKSLLEGANRSKAPEDRG